MFALQSTSLAATTAHRTAPTAVNRVVAEKLKAKTYDEIRARILEERHKAKKT